MCEDSDQETSEFDIEARTWNKLQTTMQLFGFREGAIKGKNLSLQEGFNLGYSEGFKLGEYLGMSKAVINCEAELQLSSTKKSQCQEETINEVSAQPCVLCKVQNSKTQNNTTHYDNIEDLVATQQSCTNGIIKTLRNSDLESYFDKK